MIRKNRYKVGKYQQRKLDTVSFEKQLKKALEEGTEKSRLKNDRVKNSRG
ncbi:hypothetical protein PN294_14865 [Romboutsia sp. 1001216sp1]|nr:MULTISPECIES: hypothetical protein [unclassified Romboutsia]MDB8803445.1 hypothetical protein [Romboutsia sp. 1001216sp1]MDB8803454.1 hypothetical protein [Romboutsia sp. 1001216sp1]MDB8814835.1 hypothetical protein [Romboutsia sp. 1001216sp1]MDB8814844.1 hypothetical protein [Romboutsia sp. 1001216sp1]